MSRGDWTIAPTVGWFGLFLVVGLLWVDGDLSAIADRLTAKRDTEGGMTAGPSFAAKPAVVAETADVPTAPPVGDKGDRAKVGALEDVCLEGTPAKCKRWGMDGFYRSVARSKAFKLGRAVRVSWYGDSVIATDAIPSRLRARLQSTLGDGGAGFVYVAAPHKFCVHEGVDRSSSNWAPYAISTTHIADRWYGVGHSTAETYGGTATFKLASAAQQVELYYVAQPKGGTVTVKSGDAEVLRVETEAEVKAAAYATGTIAGGTKKLELRASGKVRVFGIGIENPTGAVVDNLGIVSINVKSFSAVDPAHFAGELAHRRSDLVMIMIGANEASWLNPGDKDTKEYQQRYEQILAPIRKGRPDAACLVVSPTDQAEAKGGGYPSRPVMPVLVEHQRKAAHAQGCAFYSTYDWMGGKGSAAKWFRSGLVGSDFQHLSPKGANKLADAVYDALMAGFTRYASP
jgi:lysophospholipase L1-like esterase